MAEGRPVWLRVVLRAERIVGSRVESAVHSDAYFDAVTRARRSRDRVTATAEAISKRVIHLANLPAGTDIRRVREQLSRMERRLVELSKQLDEQAARLDEQAAQHDERPLRREEQPLRGQERAAPVEAGTP